MSAEELPTAATPRSSSDSADPRFQHPVTQDLTFSSMSRDGQRMIFVDNAGHEFSVQLDLGSRSPEAAFPDGVAVPEASLAQRGGLTDTRAREEGAAASSGKAASAVTLGLRPREIQMRIRAGESAEEVAAAAGTTVEKIMGFAAPVIAEREHMAELAQRASLRRPAAEAGSARILADAIHPLLDSHELGDNAISWDSARRYDGRWNVTADYEIGGRTGHAELVFDAKGKYVTLQNDDARWLVGELVEPEPTPEPAAATEASRHRDDLFAARQRRMAAAVEPLNAHEAEVVEVTLADAVLADAVEVKIEVDVLPEQPADVEAPVEIAEPPAEVEEPAKPTKKKRTSVPSWDEIMFGGAK